MMFSPENMLRESTYVFTGEKYVRDAKAIKLMLKYHAGATQKEQ